MKKLAQGTIASIALLCIFITSSLHAQDGVRIAASAGTADPSAMLDIISTTKGTLIPRMTAGQRTAIASPATGLLVFQTDGTPGFYYNAGTPGSPNWTILSAGALSGAGATNYVTKWSAGNTLAGSVIYDNGTNIGIGTTSPGAKLDVVGTIKTLGSDVFAQDNNSSTSYSVAPIQVREAQYGGTSGFLPPRISFHWGGVVASQIGIESSGRISILNNPGNGYENLIANNIYANNNLYINGNYLIGNGSANSYGATTVQGERNGWGGLSFRRANGTLLGTFMIQEDYSGVYNNADNNWDWYFTNGTLSAGVIPLSRVSVDAGGGYMHLGQWGGAWNTGNGVLVQGAYHWWGVYPSNRKLKTDINLLEDAELKTLSNKLLNTPLYNYRFIDNPGEDGKRLRIGMMADEAPDEMQVENQAGINIIDGFGMMLATLKVLRQENDELKEKVKEIDELKKMVLEMKTQNK